MKRFMDAVKEVAVAGVPMKIRPKKDEDMGYEAVPVDAKGGAVMMPEKAKMMVAVAYMMA